MADFLALETTGHILLETGYDILLETSLPENWTHPSINFIEGGGITIQAAENTVLDATDVTISSSGTSPANTAGWMPLTTVVGGVPDLVWDSTDSLIPTYGPF